MSFVTCRDFVEKDMDGSLRTIHCKGCGAVIAGISERAGGVKMGRDGARVETRIEKFTRFHNFTELKIALADGSFHITTGCDKCLTHNLNVEQLRELMQTDIEEQRTDLGNITADRLAARVPLTVVGVKLGGGMT